MAKALETEDREALIRGLSEKDGEENYTELVWHMTYQNAGKTYVLAMNAGHTKETVRMQTEDSWMEMLYGYSAVLSNGYLEIILPPNSLSFFKVSDGTLPGLYQGQLKMPNVREGEYTLRNAKYAAVYSTESGARELLYFCTADETIRTRGEGEKEVRIFSWDETLAPQIPTKK